MGRPGFRGGQKPHRESLYFGQVFRTFSGSILAWPHGHDWAVVPEAQAPKNGRFIAVPGSYSRKVTHGPLE